MSKHVLVVGASGIVGRAAIDHLRQSPEDRVTGISRRPPDLDCEHIRLDLLDAQACRHICRSLDEVTHVIYAALYEKPGLIAGWFDPEQMRTNLTMLRNLMEPLTENAGDLQHVSLLQGTKAYGAHLHPMKIPGKERNPRDEHDNFYWLQEDYIRELQSRSDWSFTIWRPQIVFGHALGAPMNMLAAIGVYAALRAEKGLSLAYPGGPGAPMEATDADLLARAMAFAMDNDRAANQIFNVTNGDVFEWPNVWPTIADALNMEPGDDDPCLLREACYRAEPEWAEIVARHDLRGHSISELVGDSFYYADALLATGRDEPPPPALVSTIKLRQAGFNDCIDTEDMLLGWFRRLQTMRILPGR